MAILGIPEVIHDFNIYNTGSKIIGLTGEVALPDFEAMTETISGAGILGDVKDEKFRIDMTERIKLMIKIESQF